MGHVNVIDFRVAPFRAERFYEVWTPAAERTLAFGASSWSLTRSKDDPLHFRQTSTWENPEDFERYWFSDEITAVREEAVDYYNLPLLPTWHALVGKG